MVEPATVPLTLSRGLNGAFLSCPNANAEMKKAQRKNGNAFN